MLHFLTSFKKHCLGCEDYVFPKSYTLSSTSSLLWSASVWRTKLRHFDRPLHSSHRRQQPTPMISQPSSANCTTLLANYTRPSGFVFCGPEVQELTTVCFVICLVSFVDCAPLKMIGKGFYSKWVKSSFEQFITTQTRVGSTNGWIISQNIEICWSFIFRQFPEIDGICDVISRLRLRWMCP